VGAALSKGRWRPTHDAAVPRRPTSCRRERREREAEGAQPHDLASFQSSPTPTSTASGGSRS
jgi:hypothetical protein